ncbi:actin-like protein Arp5p [Mycena haematopus]|nr:actin-like protein Arp5p [Mycena haematopus]
MDVITRMPSPAPPALPPDPSSYDEHRSQHTPLVIDNGSTNLRYGFATSHSPRSGLNVIAKYKERRTNKPLLLFGDGVDVEGGARIQARTPWEGDENALDYAFIQLSIDADSVDHPMIMTERLCSPMHSRSLTSELLFEQYSVPSVAYCVDSIMSFYQNNGPNADGLVLSFNTASTSVIPIISGKGILSHAKRIPWGASQSADYLLKLIQLKYTSFPTRVTPAQSQWILHNFCEFSPDYVGLLRSLASPQALRQADRIIQFPFALQVQEEKDSGGARTNCRASQEQGRKLQEMAAKMRTEKLLQKETDLQHLLNLREGKVDDTKREWMAKGFDDDAALDETIKKLESDLKKARKKEAAADGGEDVEEPTFPLVDVADADLDEDGLKEKKKQTRARARREKEREREEREKEELKEEEERQGDLGGWVRKMRNEQESLMTRIRDRGRRKAALSDRKSAAAQARMKNIASLAADDRVPKKKRKGGGGYGYLFLLEDLFGANDADWAIYRKINIAAPSSDEEEDLSQLSLIEQKLLLHDPSFTSQHTHASLASKRSELVSTLRPTYDESNAEGLCRIHLNTERWRVCETWFSPAMAGVDSAGLGEVIQNVLAPFPNAEKERLVKNATLRPILPPEMELKLLPRQTWPSDPWRGMARFAQTDEFESVGVSARGI